MSLDSARSTTGDTTPIDEWYGVLAASWGQPDERLAAALDVGLFEDVLVAQPTLDALSVEHTRLFVGPGEHPCPPYESVYRDVEPDQEYGPVKGQSTDAVRRWYLEYGLATDESWSDLADHVSVELEFAGYLAAIDEDEALEQFKNEHLREWLPEFLDRVESATREPFYAVLAAATRELLDAGETAYDDGRPDQQ